MLNVDCGMRKVCDNGFMHAQDFFHIIDVQQGKVWAALDTERPGSKHQKGLADIARLIEACPQLRERVPAELIQRLV